MSRVFLISLLIAGSGFADGEFLWKFATGDHIESSPAVGHEGTVYVRSTDGYLYAVNRDGSQKWRYPASWEPYHETAPAVGEDNTVYVTVPGEIHALDPADGSLVWSYATGFYPKTPGIAEDGTLYVSDSNRLYALSPDGDFLWQFDYPTVELTAPVINQQGIIYVGCVGFDKGFNGILALDQDGSLNWEYESSDAVYTPLALGYGGLIYFGTYDRAFNALDAGTRDLAWRLQMRNRVRVPPAVGPDSTIYFGDYSYNFYAVNYYGEIKWNQPIRVTYSTPAVGADGTVYVEESANHLYAFSPDGEELWTYYYGGGANTSPAVAPDGRIYLSGWYDNSLHAILSSSLSLAQTPWPRYRHDNQHTGRIHPLPEPVTEDAEPLPNISLVARSIGTRLLVSYTLPQGRNGLLSAYDASGRRLQQIRLNSSGEAELCANLSAGVYFLKLQSGDSSATARVVLVR